MRSSYCLQNTFWFALHTKSVGFTGFKLQDLEWKAFYLKRLISSNKSKLSLRLR